MNFIAFLVHFVFIFVFLVFSGSLVIHGFRLLIQPKWLAPIEGNLIKLLRSGLVLPILFIPLAFLMNQIFPWMSAALEPSSFRAFYLNQTHFILRALIYGIIWLCLSRVRSGALILVMGLFSISFASFDWLMSIDLKWQSTTFGLIVILSGCLLAYNLCLWRLKVMPIEKWLIDLNNIQLALIASWSYLVLIQWITVWTANLPSEAAYYVHRSDPIHTIIAAILGLFQIFVPIVLLFFRRLKKSLSFTRGLALSTLILQTLFLYWMIRKEP